MFRYLCVLVFTCATLTGFYAGHHVARAQDQAEEDVAPPQAQGETAPHNPYMARMREKAEEVARDMSEGQVVALARLRQAFGMIRSVDMVQAHIAEAVELCAEANPDMEQDLMARFTAWQQRVQPVLADAEDRLSKSISHEYFDNPDEIISYLLLVEEAAKYADSQITAKPLTTSEACRRLHDSMEETKEDVAGIIEGLEWPADPMSAMPQDGPQGEPGTAQGQE